MAKLVLDNNFEVKDTSFIFDCKFHPDKEDVAFVSTIDGSIVILNTNANKGSETILNLDKHHNGRGIRKLDFLTPDKLITVAKTAKIYDLNSGQFIRKIENNENTKIYSLKVLNENIFFTGDDIGRLKMFDLRTNNEPIMNEKQNEDYLSDMDLDNTNRILLTTSGDGHLSAFNVKTKKFVLQSEPFDSGFQSVRFLAHRNKVIVGAEDGALNIFNVGEWGNISDRFPIDTSKRSFGECSIDGLEVIDEKLILTSSSDGKLRIVQIFPNKIIHTSKDHKNGIESLHFNSKSNLILSTETNNVFLHKLILGEDNLSDNDEDDDDDRKRKTNQHREHKSLDNFFSNL